MTRIRVFLLWLLLAALPIQGMAAASMLLCGPAGTGAAQASQTDHHHEATAQAGTPPPHHHQPSIDASEAATAQLPAASDSSVAGAAHTCVACATCCHAVAVLSQFASLPAHGPLPRAELPGTWVRVHAAPQPVPDKPPRA